MALISPSPSGRSGRTISPNGQLEYSGSPDAVGRLGSAGSVGVGEEVGATVGAGVGVASPTCVGEHPVSSSVAPAAVATASRRSIYSRRRSEAQRVSSWREESCSLRSTEDMWVSTVLMEMNSSLATSL